MCLIDILFTSSGVMKDYKDQWNGKVLVIPLPLYASKMGRSSQFGTVLLLCELCSDFSSNLYTTWLPIIIVSLSIALSVLILRIGDTLVWKIMDMIRLYIHRFIYTNLLLRLIIVIIIYFLWNSVRIFLIGLTVKRNWNLNEATKQIVNEWLRSAW